jgi:signal transduction histidine kinase
MNIKNKLYISAGISIVLVVALVSMVLVTSGRIAEENKKHQLLMDVYKSVSELDIVTYDYLLHREKRMEHQWNIKHDSLGEILDGLAEEEGLKSIRADYATLGNLFSQVTENYRERQEYIREGASQKKIDALTGLEERLVAQLLITSHSIIADASRLAEEAHTEATETQRVASNLTVILMIVLAIAITTSSLIIARSISKPLTRLADYSRRVGEGEYTADIEIKGKDEVASVASDVKSMVGQLRKHREHLEELVEERTSDLKARTTELEWANTEVTAINKELEAFAYSVSHDLRAPLRAIDGFSQILVEDYGDKLDENGQHQLDVIQGSARQMGQLIDDLLAFSRLGRKGMSMSEIDMGVLAQEVFEQLHLGTPGRAVKLKVDTLPPADGDRAMIREVLVNFLSNAMKFTRPGKAPVIEVTGTVDENENVYSVKDKGVGFDMKYGDKLFQVFQRLHSAEEYEGTGIGLALVQRIIHRHGGRVWAKGKVNKGATFYFTLPGKSDK